MSGEASATPTPPQPGANALDLGAGSAYVTFGDKDKLDVSQFTIETWFRRDGPGTAYTTGSGGIDLVPLVTHGAPEADGSNLDANWVLGINASGNVLAADFEDEATGLNHPVSGTTAITDGSWHHAAATYDGTTWRLYLDGRLETTLLVGAFTPQPHSIQGAGLGAMFTSTGTALGHFDGALDEARVWSVARTGAQIAADVNHELTSGSGLVARWGMSEAEGAVVGDSITTPPAADGTIMGTGYSRIASAPFNITIPNTAPTVSAGPDRSVAFGVSAALAGSASDDGLPAPATLALAWTKVSGPGTVAFANAAVAATTATFSSLGTYELRLTASDGELTASDDVRVVVYDPAADPILVGAGDIADSNAGDNRPLP